MKVGFCVMEKSNGTCKIDSLSLRYTKDQQNYTEKEFTGLRSGEEERTQFIPSEKLFDVHAGAKSNINHLLYTIMMQLNF